MMKSMMILTHLFVCIISMFYYVDLSSGCNHKNFGQDTTVCVCSEKYCDTLKPIQKSPSGLIQIYSTSRDGTPPDRFKRCKDLHFSNETFIVSDGIEITIDPNEKRQKIIGFGGAITDSAGFNFKQLPESLQNRLIKDYFSAEGLEYSACRVPIGCSDMSLWLYSDDDDDDGDDFNLDNFQLQREDLKLKIPFLRMAQQATPHKPLKIFGSAWSPPAWMKTNHNMTNGGQLKGDPNGPYYQAYAKYLIRFIEEYQKSLDISFWGMTIVNEPNIPTFTVSLDMSASQQRDFIKYDLRPQLSKHNLTNLNVMIWDYNMLNMTDYVETILSDTEAARYTSGIAFHWYDTNDRSNLTIIHQKFPEHFLLSTEACQIFLGDTFHAWEIAKNYANDIIEDLNNFASGWIDWNMLLDMQGGPTWIHNYLNASIMVNADVGEYYKQPSYYILGHFSKFLPPESQRIDYYTSIVNNNNNNPKEQMYKFTVFERPDGGTVLIISNYGDQPETFLVNDPRYGNVKIVAKQHSIQSLIWY